MQYSPIFAERLRAQHDHDAVAGRHIRTVEGLGTPEAPHALQAAFLQEQAGQCGYCLSGMLIASAALLKADPAPDEHAVRGALERNLCRCGSHNRIIRAVLRAAAAIPRGDAAPSPEGAALEHERSADLLEAVSRLEERDRDVLVCRYFLELSEEETAAVLDVRRGTVKSRTARALERLRAVVEA